MATLVATRSPLFYASVRGGLPAILDATIFPGNIFYVDSNAAGASDTAGHGYSPDKPFATIDFAIGQCTANQGDAIIVLPGHAETLAALITADMAGVRIIGQGVGNSRPALTVNAVIDGISITAADVVLENLRFVTPGAAATALINIAAARATIRRCRFELGANVVDAITITAAGEEPTIEDCEVVVTANGPDSWLKFEGVVDRPIVRRNDVVASDGTNPFDDGVLDFNAVAVTNPMVYDNRFDGADVVTTVLANIGAVVGGLYGYNAYAGSATFADNCPGLGTGVITAAVIAADAIGASEIANAAIDAATFAAGAIDAAAIANGAIDAATFAAGAIDAAAIAAGAIDAATFAADALQAMQDEAEDALEGENLDHLAATTTVAADMTAEVVDGSVISRILSKTSDTSTYSPTTDALEMTSDKLGAFSGDGGAAQDDSVKASLDLAHTDIDAILADTGTDGVLIAAGGITAAKFAAGAIDAAAIANGAIDAATFAAGAIDAAAIAAGAIDAATFAAGAIDAAAIAAGAIDAATFAAGAIDAAAIANGAIDAATFAAGAIDAAAIANAAIDAATFAAGAIDAAAIAADAITNAKIADNAFASEQFALSAGEKTTDGVVVTRATAALPQTAAAAIFTVTGLVLLKRLVGYVTVNIGAVANATKLVGNSTGAGASTDLCGTLDINGKASDNRLEITGTFANPMVATLDVPLAKVQATEVVIPPGTIDLNCAGSDGGTGRVRWSATYVPLESGAQIVAA